MKKEEGEDEADWKGLLRAHWPGKDIIKWGRLWIDAKKG